jgi:hypothetical protein
VVARWAKFEVGGAAGAKVEHVLEDFLLLDVFPERIRRSLLSLPIIRRKLLKTQRMQLLLLRGIGLLWTANY